MSAPPDFAAASSQLLRAALDIADATDDLAERRRALLDALIEIVGADAGYWLCNRMRPESGNILPLGMIERNFSAEERQRWDRFAIDERVLAETHQRLAKLMQQRPGRVACGRVSSASTSPNSSTNPTIGWSRPVSLPVLLIGSKPGNSSPQIAAPSSRLCAAPRAPLHRSGPRVGGAGDLFHPVAVGQPRRASAATANRGPFRPATRGGVSAAGRAQPEANRRPTRDWRTDGRPPPEERL